MKQRSENFQTIASEKFPGHCYQLVDQLGQGGMGTVFSVKLCEVSTIKVRGMYACKVILRTFIMSQQTEKRKLDLQREIELLKLADEKTSVKFIEHIEQPDRTVLI